VHPDGFGWGGRHPPPGKPEPPNDGRWACLRRL